MIKHPDLLPRLKREIKGDVLSDPYSLGMYATDASIYQIFPQVIVLPKDEADVKRAVRIAFEYSLSILPRGGGTSLAGQTVGNSLILDFSKYMNQIIELDQKDHWVRVQPGLVRDELNAFLAPSGLHFAPDPATSSRANVGGMVGNNSSGTKSILYGKTVDHVLEAKVLLTDGTILHLKEETEHTYAQIVGKKDKEAQIFKSFRDIIFINNEEIITRFPKVMRRVGGYNLDEFVYTRNWNLAKLITGSEGTLATILELKLKLEPLPANKSVCVAHFEKLSEAIEAVGTILEYQPAAIEILDKTVVRLSRENLTTQRSCHFIEGDPAAILIIEFYGNSGEEVLSRPNLMKTQLIEKGMGYAYPIFSEGNEYEDVWVIRKKGLGLMLGIKGNKKPLAFIEDAGIPTEVLPQYIESVLQLCQDNETQAAMYAHASVGVIHVRPILDLRDPVDIQRFKNIADGTFQLVKEYGGSWSGEHGDGLVRSFYNRAFFGDQLYEAFKQVKALFDPLNLMNPGKIVEAPDIRENLRYGTDYKDQPLETVFQYKSDGGFHSAVHMCTGVGECRKTMGGTMCPSFKATRDEEHSTRGRANALRLAMSDQLDGGGLAGHRMKEVMDLCLSCKACKSECPSNVDVAKLKSDVLQMHYDQHGMSLRERLIRNSSKQASRFSGAMAPLINRIQSNQAFRYLMDKWVGIDRRRTLPAYTSQPFFKWFEKNGNRVQSDRKVVLFADTYLNYFEPSIGIAAVKLLNDCGYEVLLANIGCCQRPKLSNGFLRAARKEGQPVINRLRPYLDQGLPVVLCEPSCASALNDDWPDLLEEESLAKQLSRQVMMIDQFLEKERAEGRLTVEFEAKQEEIIQMHGHCHQKALYGTAAIKNLLGLTGLPVEEIPSGCCGMAGSFGYEKEHYELSKKIGEEVLFPNIREKAAAAQVVASGFSCRHQIEHFTGKKARHWIEVVKIKGQ